MSWRIVSCHSDNQQHHWIKIQKYNQMISRHLLVKVIGERLLALYCEWFIAYFSLGILHCQREVTSWTNVYITIGKQNSRNYPTIFFSTEIGFLLPLKDYISFHDWKRGQKADDSIQHLTHFQSQLSCCENCFTNIISMVLFRKSKEKLLPEISHQIFPRLASKFINFSSFVNLVRFIVLKRIKAFRFNDVNNRLLFYQIIMYPSHFFEFAVHLNHVWHIWMG